MNDERPLDDIIQNIQKYGWHCVLVFPDNDSQEHFAYTIGLEETYSHPEILVYGLKQESLHPILANCVDEIQQGNPILPFTKRLDILVNPYEVYFHPIDTKHFGEYLGIACDYYSSREEGFRAMLLVYPDAENKLPWEEGCNKEQTNQAEALALLAPPAPHHPD